MYRKSRHVLDDVVILGTTFWSTSVEILGEPVLDLLEHTAKRKVIQQPNNSRSRLVVYR